MSKTISLILLSGALLSCSHKYEGGRERPSAPVVASQTLVISGVPVVASVSELESFNGPPLEGDTLNQISFKLTLDGQSQTLNVVHSGPDEQMMYLTLGNYAVSLSTRCVSTDTFAPSGCSKFYLITWVAQNAGAVPESQMGLVKLLDGSRFADGLPQFSISRTRPEGLLSSLEMSVLLDGKK